MLTEVDFFSSYSSSSDMDSLSSTSLDPLTECPMEESEFEYIDPSFSEFPSQDASSDTNGLSHKYSSPSSSSSSLSSFQDSSLKTTISLEDILCPSSSPNSLINPKLSAGVGTLPAQMDPRIRVRISHGIQPESLFYNDSSMFHPTLTDSGEDLLQSDPHTPSLESKCDLEFSRALEECDPEALAARLLGSPLKSDRDDDGTKSKISPLQRRALDSIFCVTDRPSRGLVLHIASELGLHTVTVKNFFSNGRRRMRRAAARLSDPEKTRRENQRRKEKRRLAAMAAAAASTASKEVYFSPQRGATHGEKVVEVSQKEPVIVSPERRALMEKLADKVQRSAAQRNMAAASAGSDVTFQGRQIPSPFSPSPLNASSLGSLFQEEDSNFSLEPDQSPLSWNSMPSFTSY